MKRSVALLVPLCLFGLFVICGFAATQSSSSPEQPKTARVKKRTGETVIGEIRGRIVQASEPTEVEEESRTVYLTFLVEVAGADIDFINETGVHVRPGSKALLLFIYTGSHPSPNLVQEVLTKVHVFRSFPWNENLDFEINQLEERGFRVKVVNTSIGITEQRSKAPRLLGEWREGKIIPALEISTANGIVTVPITEIVEFLQQTPKPVQ